MHLQRNPSLTAILLESSSGDLWRTRLKGPSDESRFIPAHHQ